MFFGLRRPEARCRLLGLVWPFQPEARPIWPKCRLDLEGACLRAGKDTQCPSFKNERCEYKEAGLFNRDSLKSMLLNQHLQLLSLWHDVSMNRTSQDESWCQQEQQSHFAKTHFETDDQNKRLERSDDKISENCRFFFITVFI